MNIVEYLFTQFVKEEKTTIIIIIILSLIVNSVQINLVSFITASIIESVNAHKYTEVNKYFTYFVGLSILFCILHYGYRHLQNNVLMKIMQWTKLEIFKIILTANNENMSDVNFVEFITPITRISVSGYMLFNNFISTIIPTTAYLLVIFAFFLYKNIELGVFFLLGNLAIILYVAYFWREMLDRKSKNETKINENEQFIIDILNNIDKVIFRGQINNEIDNFAIKTDESLKTSNNYIDYANMHITVITGIVYFILFASVGYIIKLHKEKRITSTIFITFFTILLLYRNKITGTANDIPDYLEFIGRIDYMISKFGEMIGDNKSIDKILEDAKYADVKLEFNKIRFDHVTFKYKSSDTPVFKDKSINLHTSNNIIGITGLSGKGKSSFAKLILKMYKPDSGAIYIDDKDISTIDANYIRQNITYVNQSGKLFNKKMIDNMLYGCNHDEKCKAHLEEILKYPKIGQLYKNVDIYDKLSGGLGENLSGGQRQIVNIISGLINPCQILILDEPTNSLDPELKAELINIIYNFKKYKKCIMIITHDKYVHSIFDETIQM